jgi:hypothetical protein
MLSSQFEKLDDWLCFRVAIMQGEQSSAFGRSSSF